VVGGFVHENHSIRVRIACPAPRNSSEWPETPWIRAKKIHSYAFFDLRNIN
jgi:hypothetical protein